jgi:hypothetical protein
VKVYVNTLRITTSAIVASALLAGCSGGSNGSPPISSTNPLTSGTLQFAVGTANLYGTETGLNVVSTYRQASGLSAVLVDTPTITGPFTLPASGVAGGGVDAYSTLPDGPSVEEVATGSEITGTSQFLAAGTPTCDSTTPCTEDNAQTGGTTTIPPNTSTFGTSGGVFTNGISYVPYKEPLYDTSANVFVPFGGPPAFPGDTNGLGLRDGLFNLGAGVLGVPLGVTTFAGVGVRAGSYKLALTIPTGPTSSGVVSTTATLASTATLGTITAPALTLDANGGGTFTVTALPAGVTEELVQIVDVGPGSSAAGNCQGAIGAAEGAGPVYYTILVKAPGTYTLPDTIGPNTSISGGATTITPSPSICTAAQNTAANGAATGADAYTVQAIGADYPLYESLYPNSKSETPTIAGASGQSDITISALTGTGAATSSAKMRASLHTRHWMGAHRIN